MELRPYQQEARQAVTEKWNNGDKRTLLVLPTGCGKTIVFAKISEDCVRHGDRVLILAHRGELLDQAAEKIKKSTGLGCAVEKAEESCLLSTRRHLLLLPALSGMDGFGFTTQTTTCWKEYAM